MPHKVNFRFYLILFLFLPSLALAAADKPPQPFQLNVPIPGIPNEGLSVGNGTDALGQYIQAWYGFVIGAVGILATVMIMWAGFKWLTSRGNSKTISDAKEIIWSSIIGLLIAFLSYTILHLIDPDLTNIAMPELTKNLEAPAVTQPAAPGTETDTNNQKDNINQAIKNAGGIAGEKNEFLRYMSDNYVFKEDDSALQQYMSAVSKFYDEFSQNVSVGGNNYFILVGDANHPIPEDLKNSDGRVDPAKYLSYRGITLPQELMADSWQKEVEEDGLTFVAVGVQTNDMR